MSRREGPRRPALLQNPSIQTISLSARLACKKSSLSFAVIIPGPFIARKTVETPFIASVARPPPSSPSLAPWPLLARPPPSPPSRFSRCSPTTIVPFMVPVARPPPSSHSWFPPAGMVPDRLHAVEQLLQFSEHAADAQFWRERLNRVGPFLARAGRERRDAE